jgi:hypothetical protein
MSTSSDDDDIFNLSKRMKRRAPAEMKSPVATKVKLSPTTKRKGMELEVVKRRMTLDSDSSRLVLLEYVPHKNGTEVVD